MYFLRCGVVVLLLLCLIGGNVFADSDEVELERIVVTPYRMEEATEYKEGNVEVIENPYLKEKNIVSIGESLKFINGIDVVGGGKFGSQSEGVWIRGAATRHTTFMLEGIKIYDPSNTSAYYVPADFLVSGLERIEVVKTPLSSLYGSSPLGGVINFLVKKPKIPPYILFEIEGGSFYTTKKILELGGRVSSLSYLFNICRLDTDGFSKAKEKNNNPEKDPYQNTNFTLNLNYNPDEELEIGFLTKAIHSRTEMDDDDNYDGVPEDDEDNIAWNNEVVNTIYLKKKINPLLSYKIQGGFTSIYRKTKDDTEEYVRDWYKGNTYQFLSNLEFSPFDFCKSLIGFDYTKEQINSYADYGIYGTSSLKRGNRTKGFFSENIIYPIDSLKIDFSYRLEKHPIFKDHSVIKGGLSHKIPNINTEVYSLYSEGFKTPSLFQLYSSSGNSELKPEESKSWEIGFNQPIGDNFSLSFSYFHYNFDNLIDFVYINPADNTGKYLNAAKAKSRGIEIAAKLNLSDALQFKVGYTNLRGEQDYVDGDMVNWVLVSTDIFRRSPIRIPKHKAFFGIKWENKKINASSELFYVSKRTDRIWKTVGIDSFDEFVTMKPYLLGNISINYNVSNNTTIFIKINNIFNKDYERIKGYQEEKTATYAGIKTKF